MNKLLKSIGSFVREEDGSEVVEYALIIAVVSIGLVIALGVTSGGIGAAFSTLIGRVTQCFTAGVVCK
jgi:pilus assembly protein Flp/PilA